MNTQGTGQINYTVKLQGLGGNVGLHELPENDFRELLRVHVKPPVSDAEKQN